MKNVNQCKSPKGHVHANPQQDTHVHMHDEFNLQQNDLTCYCFLTQQKYISYS